AEKQEDTPAATEPKAAESPRVGPPPLPVAATPSVPVRSAGPPPLPAMTSASVTPGPGSSIPATAHEPPEGETIWSPYVAILCSLFLSPAFGGFVIWRNWLKMNL